MGMPAVPLYGYQKRWLQDRSRFKLGRWSRAKAAFREAARTPEMAALAHYNLGLTALGASEEKEAARLRIAELNAGPLQDVSLDAAGRLAPGAMTLPDEPNTLPNRTEQKILRLPCARAC